MDKYSEHKYILNVLIWLPSQWKMPKKTTVHMREELGGGCQLIARTTQIKVQSYEEIHT